MIQPVPFCAFSTGKSSAKGRQATVGTSTMDGLRHRSQRCAAILVSARYGALFETKVIGTDSACFLGQPREESVLGIFETKLKPEMNKTEYQNYLKSDHWKNLKSEKEKSRSKRCAICGDDRLVDLHHLRYKNIVDVDTSDLRWLCRRCHFLTHDLIKEGKLVFKGTSHHSIFASTKAAVKKALGFHGKDKVFIQPVGELRPSRTNRKAGQRSKEGTETCPQTMGVKRPHRATDGV